MTNSVSFITLGCAKNEVDSAHMQKDLLGAGYAIVDSSEKADAVVINTCSFIQDAIEESLEVIFDVASEQAVIDGSTKLVVCGCLPSRYGSALADELPEVDSFVTCSDEESIVEVIDGLFKPETHQGTSVTPLQTKSALEFSWGPSAYVKISDGCDRHCSYCTIPFIRGHYHSFLLESIMNEVEQLVSGGTKEIVLIAQDSGLWGSDFDNPDSLAHLLDVLATTFEQTWFRVMYLQPEGISDNLLDVMAAHANICHYFDIPLQHCNTDILASMNRSGSASEYLQTIKHIRSVISDVALRTTLIVGYPGETEAQFQELCDFVEQAEFDYVGIFQYSPEEGTQAAALTSQVDDATKLERFQVLRDISDAISAARIKTRIGTVLDVLVLGTEEDGQWYGRAMCQAPEVDGVTYLENTGFDAGSVVPVRIIDTLYYEMEGSCERANLS